MYVQFFVKYVKKKQIKLYYVMANYLLKRYRRQEEIINHQAHTNYDNY